MGTFFSLVHNLLVFKWPAEIYWFTYSRWLSPSMFSLAPALRRYKITQLNQQSIHGSWKSLKICGIYDLPSGVIKYGWLENPLGMEVLTRNLLISMVHFPANHVWLLEGNDLCFTHLNCSKLLVWIHVSWFFLAFQLEKWGCWIQSLARRVVPFRIKAEVLQVFRQEGKHHQTSKDSVDWRPRPRAPKLHGVVCI